MQITSRSRIATMLAALALLASIPMAHANNVPTPTPSPSGNATATASSVSDARAAAASRSDSASTSDASATQSQTAQGGAGGAGGNATSTAAGGAGGHSDAEGGEATGGNVTMNHQRSLPPVMIPGAFPSIGCGRGVSLGGTGLTGGGAVAFNWSNKDCEEFARHVSLSQAFAAIGMQKLSCETLLALPLAGKIWAVKPTCPDPAPPVDPTPPVDLSNFATKADLAGAVAKIQEGQKPAVCPVVPVPVKPTTPRRPPGAGTSGACAAPAAAKK